MNQTGTWYSARSAQHEARRSSAHSPHGDILFRFPFYFPLKNYFLFLATASDFLRFFSSYKDLSAISRSSLILYCFSIGVKRAYPRLIESVNCSPEALFHEAQFAYRWFLTV